MVLSLLAIDCEKLWSQLHTKDATIDYLSGISPEAQLKSYFQEAYEKYPILPAGLLEAMSFNTTRLKHRRPDEAHAACSGTPQIHGVMALVKDGKGLINNTLYEVAAGCSYSATELLDSPRKNILGVAEYLALQGRNLSLGATDIEKWIPIVEDFIGIPDESDIARFLKDNFIWVVLRDVKQGITFKNVEFSRANPYVDPPSYFDEAQLNVLQQKVVRLDVPAMDRNAPVAPDGEDSGVVSQDYSGADWVPTTCHSSRNGVAITDVVIHDMEGYFTYTTYTLFHNCNYSVSAHYCLRSSDGYIVQLVRESRKAWHVGGANSYSIGLEHEGFANDASWYTTAMYNSSAALVKDITQSGYGIAPTTCYNGPSNTAGQIDPQPTSVRIKGHCHYPLSVNGNGHWDPGPNWDWPRYYNLINGGTGGGGGNCPSTLTRSGTIANGLHQASSSITSTGTVISGRNITFRSPTVKLNGGFKVNLGGTFKTIQAGCTSSRPDLPGTDAAHAEEEAEQRMLAGVTQLSVVPNPLKNQAVVRFELPARLETSLEIRDARGQLVRTLLRGEVLAEGPHEVALQLNEVANGYYYCILQTPQNRKVVNVVVMK